MSIDDPAQCSTSESEAESPSYVYCNSLGRLDRLTALLNSILQKTHKWQKPHVFIGFEGRHLGRVGGRLGLVELGIDDEIFLLDVLTYGKTLDVLKDVLANPEIEKIMWDVKNAGSELHHGHEISVQSVIDLQLVQVYENAGGHIPVRGFVPAESIDTAFLSLSQESHQDNGIDLHIFKRRLNLTEAIT